MPLSSSSFKPHHSLHNTTPYTTPLLTPHHTTPYTTPHHSITPHHTTPHHSLHHTTPHHSSHHTTPLLTPHHTILLHHTTSLLTPHHTTSLLTPHHTTPYTTPHHTTPYTTPLLTPDSLAESTDFVVHAADPVFGTSNALPLLALREITCRVQVVPHAFRSVMCLNRIVDFREMMQEGIIKMIYYRERKNYAGSESHSPH